MADSSSIKGISINYNGVNGIKKIIINNLNYTRIDNDAEEVNNNLQVDYSSDELKTQINDTFMNIITSIKKDSIDFNGINQSLQKFLNNDDNAKFLNNDDNAAADDNASDAADDDDADAADDDDEQNLNEFVEKINKLIPDENIQNTELFEKKTKLI